MVDQHNWYRPADEAPMVLGFTEEPGAADVVDAFLVTGPTLQDIYELWMDPQVIHPTVRQRLLAMLTAPPGHTLPYPHPEASIEQFMNLQENVDGEPTRDLRRRMDSHRELVPELVIALCYWWDNHGNIIAAEPASRTAYAEAMRALLPLALEQDADELYARYPLTEMPDPQSPPRSPQWVPAGLLIQDSGMPKRYRLDALNRWITAAQADTAMSAGGAAEHGEAWQSLQAFLQDWAVSEDMDGTLVTELIRFMEGSMAAKPGKFVPGTFLRNIAVNVNDPDLCFDFVVRHLCPGPEGDDMPEFVIENDRDVAFIEDMLEEARARGHRNLEAAASTLLSNYAVRKAKLQQHVEHVSHLMHLLRSS